MAYFNGRIIPEVEVTISPHDRGFILGDAAYEVSRTYQHKPFHLDWHLTRLYESLSYLRLDPLLPIKEMYDRTLDVLEENLIHVQPGDDVSLTHRVTRGRHMGPFKAEGFRFPTVLITCRLVNFAPFAPLYRHGVELQTPSLRVPTSGGIDPRVKTHSRLQFALGAIEVASSEKTVLPLFSDTVGHVTESSSSNVFFVHGQELFTPPDPAVLGGITRRIILDISARKGLSPSVRPVSIDELSSITEAFITATSFGILPVRQLNARPLSPVPGPVTERLTKSFSHLVGLDIVRQAEEHAREA